MQENKTALRNRLFGKCLWLFLGVCSFIDVSGCTAVEQQFRAHIDNDSRWKLIEDCSTEQCYPKADYLKSDDMTIRVMLDRDWKGDFFMIQTRFLHVTRPFSYIPSRVTVQLMNGRKLTPKALKCSHTEWAIQHLRAYSSIEEPVSVNKEDCFLLFFDSPTPSLDDVLTVNMKQALMVAGKQIDVPLILFKRNPKFRDKEGK